MFKPDHGDQGGGDGFVTEGFTNWRNRERLQVHVGPHDSTYNIALGKCLASMIEKSHIIVALSKQTNEAQIEYCTRLTASIDVIRLLLRQGLPFRGHDESKLIRITKFYPSNFSPVELMVLESQLGTYILDVHSMAELSNVMGIGELAIKLVKLKMDDTYPLVYLLVKLALLLHVATASVERTFSFMKIVKTRLRNRMRDEWMNDSLVAYIERGILKTIDNDSIIKRFQNMKTRRVVL
ncbi:Dimer_Tnp_hAT domain-containing protein/DUF4371 domain-containing protein [Cephalotus follicularis]|uniref:Dimer_Tnp_hAT domain-containing protein/DUF4371 domain-containing protein n=1 Tax=Cephalotus follicularis TaxID=3775 RepID=A0A1Q3B074_CEPFO|nr:Dimer_Tnp_hAT domain-containing protein/DUF4371 domain-containing protein [Cephalotus follicularis]